MKEGRRIAAAATAERRTNCVHIRREHHGEKDDERELFVAQENPFTSLSLSLSRQRERERSFAENRVCAHSIFMAAFQNKIHWNESPLSFFIISFVSPSLFKPSNYLWFSHSIRVVTLITKIVGSLCILWTSQSEIRIPVTSWTLWLLSTTWKLQQGLVSILWTVKTCQGNNPSLLHSLVSKKTWTTRSKHKTLIPCPSIENL